MSDAQDFPWNTHRQTPNPPKRNPLDGYNRKPKVYNVNGKDTPLYGLGALAYVLDRKTATIRDWEEKGWLPVTPAIFPTDDPKDPVTVKHGQRRLYPEDLILAIYEVARQEGVLDKGQVIKHTRFVPRIQQLFRAVFGDQAKLRITRNNTEHYKERA
jgi:hypothetical protein